MIQKKELLQWYDEKFCLAFVKRNGYALQFVKNPTKEICIIAVKQKPNTIQYVDLIKFPEIWDRYVLENV